MEAERNGEFLFKGTHRVGMLEQGCPNFYHRGSQTEVCTVWRVMNEVGAVKHSAWDI